MTTIEQTTTSNLANINPPEAAKTRWLRFFGIFFSAALISFSLLCEVAAYALRGIQPFRTSLDTIAVAAEKVPGNADWLIFGDSLTQHVLMDYALGPPSFVANLTTHAGAGMPSMYLLLHRYLATHSAPKAILLAMSPETMEEIPSQVDGTFWLTSTFLKPDEQIWLSHFYSSAQVSAWRPAAFNLRAAILNPLTGLLAPSRNQLITGTQQPSPTLPTEAPVRPTETSLASDRERGARHLQLGTTRQVLADICNLTRDNHIAVHLIISPMPAALWAEWNQRGDLTNLKSQVGDVMTQNCGTFYQADMNSFLHIPNFDEGGTHIIGSGWANQYAIALQNYMKEHDPNQTPGSKN